MSNEECRAEAVRLRTQERLGPSAIAKRLGRGVSTICDWLNEDSGRVWWQDDMSDSRRARWYKQQSDEQIAVLEAHGVWYGPGPRPEKPQPKQSRPKQSRPNPLPRFMTTGQIIQNIMAVCAEDAGVGVKEITGSCRGKVASEARMAAIYLAKQHCGLGVAALGRRFGRDHSTIASALKRVDADLANGGKRFGGILLQAETRLGFRQAA